METPAMQLHGTVTVGSKGQVVIPKEVRSQLGIDVGDKLVVVTKENMAVGLIQAHNMSKMLSYLQNELDELQNE